MVIGASGAGKSTYALGLAGRMNGDSGGRIYRYLRRQKDSDSLGELTAALSCIAKPTLFIVDDLNSWAALPAIEKLAELAAASPQAFLLATISSEDAGSVERLGLVSRSHQFVVWESLRDTLAANLIANEYLATERLMQMRNAGNTRVAFGHDHTFWKDNVEEAAQAAQSAYDLVFRIRGSREGAREAARAFLDREGSHLAVLAAAIEQIAGFERPVFPRDVATLLQTLPAAPELPPSNADWVERVYQRGVRQRHLTAARGAYTTVHRRWAADFIDECLALPTARAAASQLLTSEFMGGFQSPARLMRLWSWLHGKPACEPFCVEWMQRLGRSGLTRLGACMMADGSLGIFSYFVHESFFFSRADSWKPILRDILVDNEVRLTALVLAAGPAEWRTLRDLFNVTELVAPGLLKRILTTWPAERMARLVGATFASQYTNVYWTFGSISKADPEWAAQVGKELQWPEIKRSLETAPPGVVSDLGDLLQALAIMRFTFMRSMSRDYLKAVGRTLENVSLDDLHVSFGDTWFDILVALFCEEADLEFARIDHARWARELTQGLSRRWEVLSFVHNLFLMAGSRQLQKVFSQIDRTQLADMISRHAPTYRQELRWVLLISASFDELTRAEWSEFCRPQVETILAARTKEASSLLTDFSRLDPIGARGLATRYGVTFKVPKELSSYPHILRKQRAECKRKDALGTDYDTELLRWEEPAKKDSAATALA